MAQKQSSKQVRQGVQWETGRRVCKWTSCDQRHGNHHKCELVTKCSNHGYLTARMLLWPQLPGPIISLLFQHHCSFKARTTYKETHFDYADELVGTLIQDSNFNSILIILNSILIIMKFAAMIARLCSLKALLTPIPTIYLIALH